MILVCKECSYRWNGNKRSYYCPCCKSRYYHESEGEGEACGLDGGTCDLCGTWFTTELLHAKYCPNCGSEKWDGGKPQPKIRPPNVWTRAIVKDTRKGSRLYVYYMATWREGPKTVNRHLGSREKLSLEDAKAKALRLKTDALEKFYGNPSYSSINAND